MPDTDRSGGRSGIAIWVVLFLFLGCTVHRIKYRSDFDYLEPPEIVTVKSKEYSATFDRVWEGVVSFFAERNISIETIEKDSGIVAAEKMFANVNEARAVVLGGHVRERRYKEDETVKPSRAYGSANPAYVREHGKVVDTSEELISDVTRPAEFGVVIRFNVFCREVDTTGTSVVLNLQITPVDKVHDTIPSPKSAGVFEGEFFRYLDEYVQSDAE